MPLIRETRRDLESDIKTARKIRLRWWFVLYLMILGVAGGYVLDHAGRLNLEFPLIVSGCALGFVIAVKWELRRSPWFWIAMAALTALHVPLFMFVPWTGKWIPALAMAGWATVDLIVMLAVLDLLARFMKLRGHHEGFLARDKTP